MFLVPIEVQCYSGYKAEEEPRSFHWLNRQIDIAEIIDRWFEGGVNPGRSIENYFKVRGADGEIFLLKHATASDDWYLCVSFD